MLKCAKDTKCISAKVSKTSNEKEIVLSKGPVCNSMSRFIIKQEANGLLSKLGIRTSLSKLPLFGKISL